MSVHSHIHRTTAPDIRARKGGELIVALTAYHAHMAAIIDKYIDIILVGDSLGMVLYGMDSTLQVTLEMMAMHGRAVVRGSEHALVVIDMPFSTYEESPSKAFHHAAYLIKETACGAVKLEGGAYMAETIHFLTKRGIPVMAHIGLTPQAIHNMGGFKTQGHDLSHWSSIKADAKAVAEAGAFAMVLEGIVEPLAAEITREASIPTIGIGASKECDGQILVLEDMLGFHPHPPKFVKQYGAVGAVIEEAVKNYAKDVKMRDFPTDEQLYKLRK